MAKKQKTDRRRPTREYWKRRSEAYNKAVLRRGERFVAEDIYSQYRTAAADIERELAMWYQRFAENNVLTAAQAKVMLNNREMEELRWSLNDYIKNASVGALSPEWMRKVQNASAKAHISRLDAINLALQQQIEKLFGGQADELDALLKDTYREGFYRTAFELDKGFGVATDMSGINMGKLETVVARPWVADGLTFSDRIWRNKETLVSELKNQLAQATIRGDDLPTAVKNLSDRLEVSRSNAARLVMTESAYFATKAQEDCYKELGVEQVEFVATLDDRTSPECQEHDGKVIDVKDIKPGDNAPPLHCWCRSCLAPYFGDKAGRSGTRAARNPETGKTEQVPADVTYPEWKRKYVGAETANPKAETQKLSFDTLSERERENEYGVPYGEKYIDADTELINSKEYRAKFSKVTENEEINDVLCNYARKAILENSGTIEESLYLIDANTGKIIAAIDKKEDKGKKGVWYTEDFKKALAKAIKDKREIISIHNHPEGFPPSIDDFKKAYTNKYHKGLAVGANGQVYLYQNDFLELSDNDCENIHKQILLRCFDGSTDPDRAYLEVYKMFGLDYTILK